MSFTAIRGIKILENIYFYNNNGADCKVWQSDLSVISEGSIDKGGGGGWALQLFTPMFRELKLYL